MKQIFLLAVVAALAASGAADDAPKCAAPLSEHGEKAQECGAVNPDRPLSCCEGYVCANTGFKCIEETSTPAAEDDASKCAAPLSEHGEKAQECGAVNPDRPLSCCEGYVCANTGLRCISSLTPAPAEDTSTPAAEDDASKCAAPLSEHGEKAQECGAINPDRPLSCCEGYVCANTGFKCVGESSTPAVEDESGGVTLEDPSTSCKEGNCTKCASPWSLHGDKAQECGASNPLRPTICCEGYTCSLGGVNGNGGYRCIALDPNKDNGGTLIVDPNQDTSNAEIVGNPKICGGFRSKSVECGSLDNKHASFCCEGYMCHEDPTQITCVAASAEYEPLSFRPDNFVQELPIELENNITVVETVYGFTATGDMDVPMPQQAIKGDLLLIFIGGSAGTKKPNDPEFFDLILAKGRSDINLMAHYKWYDELDYFVRISGGRNTFVTLSAVRGVDMNKPVVDATVTRESAPGKDGKAIAPSAFGVEGGVNFASFSFDDPHVAQLQTDGYKTVVSTHTGNGDGMALFVSSSQSTGPTPEVFVAGNPQKGGGNDVAMAVTLRPVGGPYDEAPQRKIEDQTKEERRGDYMYS